MATNEQLLNLLVEKEQKAQDAAASRAVFWGSVGTALGNVAIWAAQLGLVTLVAEALIRAHSVG